MGFYLYFALSLGPWLMRNRKPFENLKPVMLFYNFTMALLNAYFVFLVLLHCEYGQRFVDWKYPDRNNNSPKAMYELNMGWYYWITKFFDLLDTVFFVLRKKHETHLGFLHLYHHTVVPIFGYLCLKHNAVMPATGLFCLINGTIHVIMYSYYGLCLLGPSVRKYLWWKKYITQMQIGQFVFGIFYGIIMVFKQEGYPQFWFWFGMTQPFFFFRLFYNFYKKSYDEKNAAAAKAAASKASAKKVE
ncbi:PREDICTED: elongation of very long chain fatty acids protein 7-like [Rhagoletis zephyria]|uniref:elongation of very long chain fatty acids protein 7-like n=1 Tax=Rhagoletis zephyria TaxID=28612 RepID=UPI0008112A62|nr:PREDICTED: elongation of very long chain fatty acids protein 7-like [Rhagoletis zephyria]